MSTTTAHARPSWVIEELRSEIRRVPTIFAAFAIGGSVVAILAQFLAGGSGLFPGQVWADVLASLISVAAAAGPLVALRWPWIGAGLAALAVACSLLDPWGWSVLAIMALAGVSMAAMWRDVKVALGSAAAAMVLLAAGALVYNPLLVPFGLDRYATPQLGPSPAEVLSVVLAWLAALVAVVVVAFWARARAGLERRELAVATRSAEVAGEATLVGERARLARDLHDVVAHHISLIAVRAETAPYTSPELQPEAKAVLSDIATDARRALDELRGVLGILRRAEDGSQVRAPQPRLSDVAELVDAARSSGAGVRVDGDLTVPVGTANGYVTYRVVQEALTNARRHAPGRPVYVQVVVDGPTLTVRVTNPRDPVAQAADRPGRGLIGMRERVEALGGTLTAGTRGDDFVVEAELPRGEQ